MELRGYRFDEISVNYDKKRIPLSGTQREKRKGEYRYYGAQGVIDYIDDYIFDGTFLLIAEDGENLKSKKQNIAQVVNGQFWVNNHAHIVTGNDLCDTHYLCYLINSMDLSGYVTGSAQPKLSQANLNAVTLLLPRMEIQKKIVDYLRKIDEKIELNTQINKNLEQQAEAIFQSILSNAITTVNLGEIADVKGGKRLPKGVNLTDIPNAHPYIRVRDLNNALFASLTPNYAYVDKETQKSISRYIVSTGDVLISIVGTIGLTAIVDSTLDKANLTENCVKVTNLKHITPEYLLLYLRSQLGREAIAKGTVGAVQQKLPIKNIQAIPIPLLSEKDKNALFCTLDSIFAGISNNVIQSAKLASLRDTLLPRLMSGDL